MSLVLRRRTVREREDLLVGVHGHHAGVEAELGGVDLLVQALPDGARAAAQGEAEGVVRPPAGVVLALRASVGVCVGDTTQALSSPRT